MLTLFTQDFRKPFLAVSAIFTGLLLYVCIVVGMISISSWAERELDAFPFKQEDWLRYLLPSRFTDIDKDMIMLTGPSTVRENLLYRQFEEAFPKFSIYQGGISLGTIDDVTASLEYIEKVYGSQSLPKIVVLGISPRFIGNIPDERPFSLGLNLYSPFYAARDTKAGIKLIPKGLADSLTSRLDFITHKLNKRFQITLLAIFNYWLSEGKAINSDPNANMNQRTTRQKLADKLFKHKLSEKIIRKKHYLRALNFEFSQILEWYISPYKYLLSKPAKVEGLKKWLNGPDTWWNTVYTWNPEETQAQTSASIKRFTWLIKTHNIQLMVINLPERDISRELFNETHYQAYLDIVKASFGNIPFLNFREFSRPEEFHDAEHTVYKGSLRLSKEIINKLKETLEIGNKQLNYGSET